MSTTRGPTNRACLSGVLNSEILDGTWMLAIRPPGLGSLHLRESRGPVEFPSDGSGEAEALPIEEAGSAA